MLVGQPQRGLGFSITDPFKYVGKAVVKTHVIGTKAIATAIKNPNVQRAAAQAGQQYAQQKYGTQYDKYSGYAQTAQSILRPPGPQAPIQTPAMMPPGDDDDAPMVTPGGAVVQKGNMLTLAMIGGAVVLLLLVMKK